MKIVKVENGYIIEDSDSSGMLGMGKKKEHVFNSLDAMFKYIREYYEK
jgi:hypothetical protein|tara:strand:+ start:6475 stop:6618 length:144 start_codon:yes stop_codon:yes gene_type:complete